MYVGEDEENQCNKSWQNNFVLIISKPVLCLFEALIKK